MRLSLVIGLLMISGCSTAPAPLPIQPTAPTDSKNLSTLGEEIDISENRVAASLVAIERNADKPAVVTAEAKLGQAYLARPSEGDIAFALARASAADPAAYAKQAEYGKRLLAAVDSKWTRLEADQKEALRVSALKDQRIAELTKQIERVKAQASKDIWSITGAGLAVIGALAFSFGGGPRVGLPILLCAGFCGALPHIIDSPAFLWVSISTAAIASGLFLWWLADKVSDAVQDKKDETEITKDE
jgi:hypothetical protein